MAAGEYRALRAREYRFAVEEGGALASLCLKNVKFLCSWARYTPICEANDTPGCTRPILPQRSCDTPIHFPERYTPIRVSE